MMCKKSVLGISDNGPVFERVVNRYSASIAASNEYELSCLRYFRDRNLKIILDSGDFYRRFIDFDCDEAFSVYCLQTARPLFKCRKVLPSAAFLSEEVQGVLEGSHFGEAGGGLRY